MVTIKKDWQGRIQRAGTLPYPLSTGIGIGNGCCCPGWCTDYEAIHRMRVILGTVTEDNPHIDEAYCDCPCADYSDTTYELVNGEFPTDAHGSCQGHLYPGGGLYSGPKCCSARVFQGGHLPDCELQIEAIYQSTNSRWTVLIRHAENCNHGGFDASTFTSAYWHATATGLKGTFTCTGGIFVGGSGFCAFPSSITLIVE